MPTVRPCQKTSGLSFSSFSSSSSQLQQRVHGSRGERGSGGGNRSKRFSRAPAELGDKETGRPWFAVGPRRRAVSFRTREQGLWKWLSRRRAAEEEQQREAEAQRLKAPALVWLSQSLSQSLSSRRSKKWWKSSLPSSRMES